jgi:hypothetical protein
MSLYCVHVGNLVETNMHPNLSKLKASTQVIMFNSKLNRANSMLSK